MRWFVVAIAMYFLGLVGLFFLGLGKMASLMFAGDSWMHMKDIFQMLSWSASIGGLFWAVKTYRDSELEKRYTNALDVLGEIKISFSDLSKLSIKRDQIFILFGRFENRLREVSFAQREELYDDLSGFCRGVLKEIECKHIFGEIKKPNLIRLYEPVNISELDAKFGRRLVNVSAYIIKAGFVTEIGNVHTPNDKNLTVNLLSKIIKYAEPLVAQNYFTSNGQWKIEKIDDDHSLSPIIGATPASIIFIFYSGKKIKELWDYTRTLV